MMGVTIGICPPAAENQRGFGGRAPRCFRDFSSFFFSKNKAFYAYVGLNFYLKTCFDMTAKGVDAPLRPAPRTPCCSKLLTIKFIVDHSYDCVIKTLCGVCS